MSNEYEAISSLPEDVQVEIMREADLRLNAQLTVAIAADQRALTYGGFLIAAATGAIGGGIALLTKEEPDFGFSAIAIIFACGMLYASWEAIHTVMPNLFCLPGNRPGLWLPDQWESHGIHPPTIGRARIEQAKHIDKMIRDNASAAELAAKHMRRSFYAAILSTTLAAAVLVGIGLFRLGAAKAEPLAQSKMKQDSAERIIILDRREERSASCYAPICEVQQHTAEQCTPITKHRARRNYLGSKKLAACDHRTLSAATDAQ